MCNLEWKLEELIEPFYSSLKRGWGVLDVNSRYVALVSSSRARLNGMSFPVLFVDLMSSIYFFYSIFYMYVENVHMLFNM